MTACESIEQYQKDNLLLKKLDESVMHRLTPHMNLVLLPQGKILHEAGIAAQYIYFPTTSIVALLCGIESGAMTQVACIGNEGVVGALDVLNDGISQMQALVQSTGYAYRIRASAIRSEFQENPELQILFIEYLNLQMSQMAQAATCIRHHTLEQQLCSWFLHCLDRLPANELLITQEFISNMLGVRREGVTSVASKLQKSGFIAYRRGRISIIDRSGLESQACECYHLVQKRQEKSLKKPAAAFSKAISIDTPLINDYPNKTSIYSSRASADLM